MPGPIRRSPWILALVGLLLPCSVGAELSLTGRWEIQSMGADRVVQVEQQGNNLVAYRLMWPEFEGSKYKLEHLYKGKIKGNNIQGDLLVKEDELPEFEVLRPFTGRLGNTESLMLDGMPMRRLSSTVDMPMPGPGKKSGKAKRQAEPPIYSR